MQGARRRRRIAASVLAGLTALGLAVAAVQLVATVRGSGQARAAAGAARAEIDAGADHLARLRRGLAAADEDLRDAMAVADRRRRALHVGIADRDDLADELAAVRAQLGELQTAISGAEVETGTRAALVTALGTCLDGVTELLNQVSVGDRGGAARTVSAIGPACAAVGTVLG